MYATDAYDINSLCFTALGVALLWGRLGRNQIEVYALSNLIRELVPNKRLSATLEFLFFLGAGVLVAIGFVQPTTIPQAIAAGLGWTGLFSHAPASSPSSP